MVLPAPLRPTIASVWPARTVKVTPLERRAVCAAVGEAHVAELDRSRERRQRHGVGALRDLAVRVEDLEDALGRRHRLLQVGVDAAQLPAPARTS